MLKTGRREEWGNKRNRIMAYPFTPPRLSLCVAYTSTSMHCHWKQTGKDPYTDRKNIPVHNLLQACLFTCTSLKINRYKTAQNHRLVDRPEIKRHFHSQVFWRYSHWTGITLTSLLNISHSLRVVFSSATPLISLKSFFSRNSKYYVGSAWHWQSVASGSWGFSHKELP